MTEDNRIPVPSFAATLAALMEVVRESPEHISGRQYLDAEGYPEDLTAHTLNRLDAPMSAFKGYRPHHRLDLRALSIPGTPWNNVHFALVWDRLFVSVPRFWDLRSDRDTAEDYLVYALFGHIVDPQGHGRHDTLTWRGDLRRGIKSFRRFLLSPSSGFLVQTHGNHADLLEYVDMLTTKALVELA